MREAVLYKIFMYLQKSYDILERDRFLEIITAYEVGFRELWLRWT